MAKLTSDTSYIPPNPNFKCTNRLSKVQEISEGNCGVFNSPKKLMKIISLITALFISGRNKEIIKALYYVK